MYQIVFFHIALSYSDLVQVTLLMQTVMSLQVYTTEVNRTCMKALVSEAP